MPTESHLTVSPRICEQDTGNKISRKCTIQGSQNIVLGGKTIIEAGVIMRGDLRRAGSGAAVVLALGKYCHLGQNCVVRPSYKTYKGSVNGIHRSVLILHAADLSALLRLTQGIQVRDAVRLSRQNDLLTPLRIATTR